MHLGFSFFKADVFFLPLIQFLLISKVSVHRNSKSLTSFKIFSCSLWALIAVYLLGYLQEHTHINKKVAPFFSCLRWFIPCLERILHWVLNLFFVPSLLSSFSSLCSDPLPFSYVGLIYSLLSQSSFAHLTSSLSLSLHFVLCCGGGAFLLLCKVLFCCWFSWGLKGMITQQIRSCP